MRRMVAAAAAAAFALGARAEDACWPILLAAGGTYTLVESDQTLVMPRLCIPAGATIKVPRGMRLNWTIESLEFGEDATLDLSAPTAKPGTAPPAANGTGQPPWGQTGPGGAVGSAGTQGTAATEL